MQTTSPCDASQDASTQTSDQLVSSLSFDVVVQTSLHGIHISSLDAAVQTIPHSTLCQNVSTQMGSRSASSFCVDIFVQTPFRSTVLHDVSTQLPLTEIFIGCIYSNSPLDRQNFVCQSPPPMQGSHAVLQPPIDSNSQPRLLSLPLTLTCLLHMVRLLTVFPAMPSSRLPAPPLWEPTIVLVLILVWEQAPSLNHGHWFFSWSNLGNPRHS